MYVCVCARACMCLSVCVCVCVCVICTVLSNMDNLFVAPPQVPASFTSVEPSHADKKRT